MSVVFFKGMLEYWWLVNTDSSYMLDDVSNRDDASNRDFLKGQYKK